MSVLVLVLLSALVERFSVSHMQKISIERRFTNYVNHICRVLTPHLSFVSDCQQLAYSSLAPRSAVGSIWQTPHPTFFSVSFMRDFFSIERLFTNYVSHVVWILHLPFFSGCQQLAYLPFLLWQRLSLFGWPAFPPLSVIMAFGWPPNRHFLTFCWQLAIHFPFYEVCLLFKGLLPTISESRARNMDGCKNKQKGNKCV